MFLNWHCKKPNGGNDNERRQRVFCKIANGEIPSATVYEDDDFRAILDLGPASNGHTLILPKNHYKDLCEADETVMAKILPLAAKLGKP